MPLYASPMFGDTTEIFLTVDSSMSVERSFFSVARTTPFVACTKKSCSCQELSGMHEGNW